MAQVLAHGGAPHRSQHPLFLVVGESLAQGAPFTTPHHSALSRQGRRATGVPPAQLGVRQTFGAAAKAWSSPGLSPQERQDVRAAAKQVQSRPRLRQSGHLFGQQYFVQQACLKKGKAQG